MNQYDYGYGRFQQECAGFGFIQTPLSFDEYKTLVCKGFSRIAIHDIACDLFSGAVKTLEEAIESYV